MFDLIIIGGGPSGLTAAIYATRYKLKTLLVAKTVGGAMADAHTIENFPGIENISGIELAERMRKQAESLGVEILEEAAQSVGKGPKGFFVNGKLESKYILFCLGTKRNPLKLARERELIGKGLSYCATCDAPFYKERIVGVVGGGDAAVMAAELLALYARKTYLIVREEELMAQPFVAERILSNKRVEPMFNVTVAQLFGEGKLEKIRLSTGNELELDGLFVEIGSTPLTELAKRLGVGLDLEGYIIVDQNMATSVKHVYAAGDATTHNAKWRQIVIACAEGALASRSIYEDTKKGAKNVQG